MMQSMSTWGDKKEKISKLLETNGILDIIEKDIKNSKGVIGVPNKYVNCKAIILIIKSSQEIKGEKKSS